jgi:hypothetical protein
MGRSKRFTFSGDMTPEKMSQLDQVLNTLFEDAGAKATVDVDTDVDSGGLGDVVGPASSVASEFALFDGATGKLLKRATGSGFVKATAGVYSTTASISLTADVSGDLPFSSLVQASTASILIGRGAGAGGGDFQEITLGSGLSMAGTVLSASGASSSTWSVLTNGDLVDPELIFAGGDVIMITV